MTTDRNDPNLKVIKPNGQQADYLVLSDEERAKGFVRPVRRTYIHVGHPICGETSPVEYGKLGGPCYVCVDTPGHGGYHHVNIVTLPQPEAARMRERKTSGCHTTTTMGQAIAETYARNPKFYGGTFCCGCGKHFPVEQFVWEDGSKVGE